MKSSIKVITLLVFFKFSQAHLQCPDFNCCICAGNFLSVCDKCCDGFQLSSLSYCEAADKFSLKQTQKNNAIRNLKVQFSHLTLTTTSKKIISKTRNLSSCPIEKCIQCDKILNQCIKCEVDYLLKDQICIKSLEDNKNGSISIGLIIIIILVPLFFTTIFCFLCIYCARKNKKKYDHKNHRDRTFSESIREPNSLFINLENILSSRAETLAYPQISEANIQEIILSFKGNVSALSGKICIYKENFDVVMRKPRENFMEFYEDDGIMCSICFEEFDDENECRITPCGHIFHRECIYAWIIGNNKRKCPNDNFKFKKNR
ncbi:hypothetical protein SteCoe_14371 [Stentor coeruleus]|uniref:RING-type domain-containing protein n=1 Tax=Stentor coeruleus TaxID=5963 RepID=A0A1R2C3Y2_9CILI|nr:hypothetical protein SteCoe_15325 [Stentor coeruleus]OMJ84486.1 hypothetical protein SteCoe_14371 [Stentor coeruleus]